MLNLKPQQNSGYDQEDFKPMKSSMKEYTQKTDGHMGGSRWGTGGLDPRLPLALKILKSKGFLSNTGPDALKNTKLPSLHSMLGHIRPASETPFKWRFAGEPMMACL